MLYSEILLNGLINKGEVAIICDDIVYTYKELIYEVDKIALGLSKEGIKKFKGYGVSRRSCTIYKINFCY